MMRSATQHGSFFGAENELFRGNLKSRDMMMRSASQHGSFFGGENELFRGNLKSCGMMSWIVSRSGDTLMLDNSTNANHMIASLIKEGSLLL